jgi:hypothetical protein
MESILGTCSRAQVDSKKKGGHSWRSRAYRHVLRELPAALNLGEEQIIDAATATEAEAARTSPAEDTIEMCLASTATMTEWEDGVSIHGNFIVLRSSLATLDLVSEILG